MCLVCGGQEVLELLGMEASPVALVTMAWEATVRTAGLVGLLWAGLLASTGLLGPTALLRTASRRRTRCRPSSS
ncbi:hypothetical protein ACOJIV_21410 [Haloarcula sp. AONF1]|uniref:hypothetical protein n=1 Tax=Haloarcula hispanica TaxID=51589 RepID=UPI0015823327|nr:hypothetical protein [Haloarcula hispanica]